jgi:hypothetical protein
MSKSVRTLIALEPAQKSWLERRSRATGRPVAQLVRDAVDLARRTDPDAGRSDWAGALAAIKGIKRGEDGLKIQRRLRDEWG